MQFLKVLITLPYFIKIFTKSKRMSRKIKKDPNLVTEEYRYKWLQKRVKYILWIKNIKIIPHNIENWSDKGCLLISNHQTNYDPLIIFSLNDFDKFAPNAFIAKKELQTDRKWGKFASLIDVLFLDRTNPRNAIEIMNKGIDLIRVPRSLVLFPEGTRSNSYEMGDFKPGLIKIAQKAHVPIIPISIVNSYSLVGKHNSKMGKKYIHVVFHKAFKPQNILNKSTDILANQIQKIIQSGISNYLNVSDKESEKSYKSFISKKRIEKHKGTN